MWKTVLGRNALCVIGALILGALYAASYMMQYDNSFWKPNNIIIENGEASFNVRGLMFLFANSYLFFSNIVFVFDMAVRWSDLKDDHYLSTVKAPLFIGSGAAVAFTGSNTAAILFGFKAAFIM